MQCEIYLDLLFEASAHYFKLPCTWYHYRRHFLLTPWPAVPHFTAYPFTPQYRTLPHLRLPAVPHFAALPYLFRFVSRKTRCSWRIECIFILLEPEKVTLYTGMKKIHISISIKVS